MRGAASGYLGLDSTFQKERLSALFMEGSRFIKLLGMPNLTGIVKDGAELHSTGVQWDARDLKLSEKKSRSLTHQLSVSN